jgi:hypothetical protein
MKKKTIYLIILIAIILTVGIYIFNNYFSVWDVTGDVTGVYNNETGHSIEVETGLFSGNQKYNITIESRSEIIFNGNNIEFVELDLTPDNDYRVKAVTGDTTLFSDPPVVRAEIIEIDEKE